MGAGDNKASLLSITVANDRSMPLMAVNSPFYQWLWLWWRRRHRFEVRAVRAVSLALTHSLSCVARSAHTIAGILEKRCPYACVRSCARAFSLSRTLLFSSTSFEVHLGAGTGSEVMATGREREKMDNGK